MCVLVGLGNPGRAYERTRHNVGFMVVDRLAETFEVRRTRRAFQSVVMDVRIAGKDALLLKPKTFMNLSGRAVAACLNWLKLEAADLLVMCDDFNLPLGRIRVRRQGSSGGHKGIESIVQCLGTSLFARVRAGIGLREGADPAEYVLERFGASERAAVETMIENAANAAACWVEEGIDSCMNKYNG